MPEEYKDTPKAIFWMAEEGFANSLREERTLFELQSHVCAFIATWLPYNRDEYCLEYLKDSPHLERLRRIYEF